MKPITKPKVQKRANSTMQMPKRGGSDLTKIYEP